MNPKDVIKIAIPRLLGDWAMMLAEPVDSNPTILDSNEPVILASVKFNGPFSGTFLVGSQRSFLHVLSDNLIGESEIDSKESQMIDTIKELSNVLTGNLLTELYGADVAFALESPRVRCLDVGEMATTFNERTTCFEADGCPFIFQFKLEV